MTRTSPTKCNINQVIMYTLFMHGLMDDDCAGTAYHAIATAPPGQVILPHAAPDPRGGGYLYTPPNIFSRKKGLFSSFPALITSTVYFHAHLFCDMCAKVNTRLRSIREMHSPCKREDARSSRAASSSIHPPRRVRFKS